MTHFARTLLSLTAGWALWSAPSGALSQTLPPGGVLQAGRIPMVRGVAGETVQFDVPLAVADGFHVQANPASNEFLIPLEFSLVDEASALVRDWKVTYPPADRMRLQGTDEDLLTYHDDITVGVQLQVAADATPGRHELQAEIRYQACDARRCLFPTSLAVTVVLVVRQPVASNAMRIRLPGLEGRYQEGAEAEAAGLSGQLPDVAPARLTLHIQATRRPGVHRCGKSDTPIFAHLHAAGRLYGREFTSECLSDSASVATATGADIDAFFELEVDEQPHKPSAQDELVLSWADPLREGIHMADCQFVGGDFDVVVQRVEILVEPR